MRTKKAIVNIMFSLLYQMFSIVLGFVIPRIIIKEFGSATNGLVNSITSFIGYISILQLGVGSVIKASLYGPLAKNDIDKLAIIVHTTNNFFRKIGIISFGYIIILAVVYPCFIQNENDFLYTFSLVLIIGISTVFEYLFGITYQMLLEADQKSYIFSIAQIITLVISSFAMIIAAEFNCSVHTLKIIGTFFLILRPILINIYCKKKYRLGNAKIIDNNVIAQRWDGFAQGMAYFLHSKTDVFVLTLFSSLENLSIYSIYAMITTGITSILTSIDKAIRSAFGNLLAEDNGEKTLDKFTLYNVLFHVLCTAIFTTATITQYNFIALYLGGVSELNYINIKFGVLIMLGEYLYCLRMPYNSIVFAAGNFKQTKKSAYIEAILNMMFSCVLVFKFGIVGVAVGTAIAMVYRTISFIIYLKNNILFLSYREQMKRYLISFLVFGVNVAFFLNMNVNINSYLGWIIYSTIIFCMTILLNIVIVACTDIVVLKKIFSIFRSLCKRIK